MQYIFGNTLPHEGVWKFPAVGNYVSYCLPQLDQSLSPIRPPKTLWLFDLNRCQKIQQNVMSKNEGILRPTDWISVLPYGVNFNPAHLIKTSWRLLYFEFDIFPARSMIVFVVVGRQLRRFWYPYSAGATEMVPTCPNHMIVAVAVS